MQKASKTKLSYHVPLFQNESSLKTVYVTNKFDLNENEHVGGTTFHMNACMKIRLDTAAKDNLKMASYQ